MKNFKYALTDKYCRGFGKRFGKNPCIYFDASVQECRLFRELKPDILWEKCRYTDFFMLYKSIDRHLDRFMNIYGIQIIDNKEDINFNDIIENLKRPVKNPGFTKYNLETWKKYINTSVYRKVREILIKRGIIGHKKECQNCSFFSQTKSNVCLLKKEIRKKTDRICEKYSQTGKDKTEQCESCEHLTKRIAHFCFKKMEPRNKTDKTCEEYKAIITNIISEIKNRENEESYDIYPPESDNPETLLEKKNIEIKRLKEIESKKLKEKDPLSELMKKILVQRVQNEARGTARRTICKRQHELFCNVLNLLEKGISMEKAISKIADGDNNKLKMNNRDINEIRIYFKENCPELIK
ncbi:Uncharacterized protein dnl_41550 [Desulfonema limicola]|uniref:Uncharacterized protein n=1 Tax=Desulfonema limicola TaxID=45656 RepID=A0A975BAN1_9BACT|nr:hypothetical protein [Desulfonema limicola]QTA81805.1 Uncharacterized protein dnl_41550 [Desulfonema limicola]